MTASTPYPLGRLLEHDPRSKLDQYRAAQAPALKTTMHRHYGKILDQGNLQSQTAVAAYLAMVGAEGVDALGSCTGNGTVQVLNSAPLRHGRPLLTEVDAIKLYSRATVLDGFPGTWPPSDDGSSGLAAMKAAKEAGYISAYHHAFGIDQALAALVLSAVIIGITWRDTMWEVDGNGYLDISGNDVGGHEPALIGLDTRRDHVVMLNSWGPTWGRNGRAYLRFADLDVLLRAQGDVTVPVL